MTIEEWRDHASHLFSMARDLTQCTTEREEWQWVRRAEKLRLESWAVGIHPRATHRDRMKMVNAKAALDAAFDSVRHLVGVPEEEVAAH
jgi:hypothetical protein